MDVVQLRVLCTKNGVLIPKEANTEEHLLDWLLAEFGV